MRKLKLAALCAHIVKFSNENIPSTDFCNDLFTLYIQIMRAGGLQFKLKSGKWIHIPAVPVENIVDWEGCGDTLTATFINELCKDYIPNFHVLSEKQVQKALEAAMKQAAICTQYIGSKGWIKR